MKTKLFLAGMLTFLSVLSVFSQKTADKPARSNTEPLKVGERAPDFMLKDEAGKALTLSKQKQAVVLVFYRGYW